MPQISPPDSMSDDGYGDAALVKKKPEGKPEEKGEEMEEFPLPKEILQGKEFNVGDEVVLRITGMHDNQVFVAYSPEKGKDEEKEGMDSEGGMGEGEGAAMQGDKGMSSLYG